MLRNYKGFTFVEIMFALVIITVTVASTAPVLFVILNERQTLAEQLTAYEILHNTFAETKALHLQTIPEKTIAKNDTEYTLYSQTSDLEMRICVQWNGRNGRTYEECGVAHHG